MTNEEHRLVRSTGKMSIQAFFERHGEVPYYEEELLAKL